MNIESVLASGPLTGAVLSAPRRARPSAASRRDRIEFRGASSAAPLQHALEEQARRVAYALHDEVGQLLASVAISLDSLREELPTAEARLLTIKNLIALVDVQLRRVVHELRPTVIDHLGLVPALHALTESVGRDLRLRIELRAEVPRQLAPDAAMALYRMVQEALTNAARHGLAGRVWIHIQREADAIQCTIEDDGRGFDVRAVSAIAGGLGLLGMRERITAVGGTLTIASSPGAGTELIATIPLEVHECPSPSSSPTTTRSCDTASACCSSATVSRSWARRRTAT